MTVETDVIDGILSAAVSAIGSSYPIKASGITFKSPDDGKFIELVLIQDNNGSETWGNEELFSGFLRVILHWPIDGQGVIPPSRVLADLKPSFAKGTTIRQGAARLLIYDVPRITDVIEEDAENLYPMTVRYQFFHAPA